MLPVTIIGGYLGAGKTTLVNHLLRHAGGVRIAVLVNEFGALPIDQDLIEAQDDALISIAGGCVCCSYGNDLVQALLDIAALGQPVDHILIETSGVALPGAIASSVSLIEGFQTDGIVVLADAETIRRQADDPYIGDTIHRQLRDADIVLTTKTDLAHPNEIEPLCDWLEMMAPGATVVPTHHANVPNDIVMQGFDRKIPDAEPQNSPSHFHAPEFESRVIEFGPDQDAAEIAQQLASPALALVRAKGFVSTPQGLKGIQVVGRRWSVFDAAEGAKPGVVVIALKAHDGLDQVEKTVLEMGTEGTF